MLIIENGAAKIYIFSLILITDYVANTYGFHILEPNYNLTQHRIRRQANCGPFDFKCNSGECISRAKLCDGVADCTDASDENLKCLEYSKTCPEFAFRCAYGACVDGDARCNGVKECYDNSDEASCTTTVASGSCGNKFSCDDGQCIDRYVLCDGKKDCNDGSDETFKHCSAIPCQEYSHRCAYGACVDGDAKCNGIKECADGSDESPQICGGSQVTPTPPTSITPPFVPGGGCILPPTPANGKYSVKGSSSGPAAPGQSVTEYTVLNLDCFGNHRLYPANNVFVICQNGQWQPSIPQCLNSCPPRISDSIDFSCELDGIKQNCSDRLIEGTLVNQQCKHLYTQQDSSNPLDICRGGTYNQGYIRCEPDCGLIKPQGTVLVIGGDNAKKGDFPWHVGVYRQKPTDSIIKHICGGSIINPKLIISAAHCFADSSNGEKHDKNWFHIGAGKYYRDFNAVEELTQKRTVKDIYIPIDYKGILSSYSADMALIIVDSPFQITHIVQPVCIDWQNQYEDEQLIPDTQGSVVGWGLTSEDNTPSNELKQLNTPYIDRGQCINVVPKDFIRFVTPDKFCAGFTNGSSVCNGDSGGGLVFYRKERNKYYLRGLVSVGPLKENTCDSHHYGVYTKISIYLSDIKKWDALTRIS